MVMAVAQVGRMVMGNVSMVMVLPVMGFGPLWTTRRVLAGSLRLESIWVPQFHLRIVLGQPAH